jgi:hypothetical protein
MYRMECGSSSQASDTKADMMKTRLKPISAQNLFKTFLDPRPEADQTPILLVAEASNKFLLENTAEVGESFVVNQGSF